jgi:hypothetical protein
MSDISLMLEEWYMDVRWLLCVLVSHSLWNGVARKIPDKIKSGFLSAAYWTKSLKLFFLSKSHYVHMQSHHNILFSMQHTNIVTTVYPSYWFSHCVVSKRWIQLWIIFSLQKINGPRIPKIKTLSMLSDPGLTFGSGCTRTSSPVPCRALSYRNHLVRYKSKLGNSIIYI